MTIILFLLVLIFIGSLSNLEKEKKFFVFKSFLIVAIETIIGSALFLAFLLLILKTPINALLLSGVGSLFIVTLLVAVVNGIILYWFNVWMMMKFNVDNRVQTLCEYIIQWSLIYITIYQVIFDNLISSIKSNGISSIDIANPSDLAILILPSLISVWISIILYKLKKNNL